MKNSFLLQEGFSLCGLFLLLACLKTTLPEGLGQIKAKKYQSLSFNWSQDKTTRAGGNPINRFSLKKT